MTEPRPEFRVDIYDDEYLGRLRHNIGELTVGDRIVIGTMMVYDGSESVHEVLEAMQTAKRDRGVSAEIRCDQRYMGRMTTTTENFQSRPRLLSFSRELRRAAHQIDMTQVEFGDILTPVKPRFGDGGTNANWLRYIASYHPGQLFAVWHAKFLAKVLADGSGEFRIGSAELRAPHQNDLMITIEHVDAARFLIKYLDPNFDAIGRSGADTFAIDDQVKLIIDHGNFGEPAQLPLTDRVVESMIDPTCDERVENRQKPKRIWWLSQYPPNGKLWRALARADDEYGVMVTIPLQPETDYRRTAFPYNYRFNRFMGKAVNTGISMPERPRPSHVKCVVVDYGETWSMMIGSENFVTDLKKPVRNTETAMHVDHAEPGSFGFDLIQATMMQLTEMEEIEQF